MTSLDQLEEILDADQAESQPCLSTLPFIPVTMTNTWFFMEIIEVYIPSSDGVGSHETQRVIAMYDSFSGTTISKGLGHCDWRSDENRTTQITLQSLAGESLGEKSLHRIKIKQIHHPKT